MAKTTHTRIMRGGVCVYIKDTISFSIVEDLADESLEVLWLNIRPHRLPRGVNNIIVGVIYHPPLASNSEMLVYLMKCLSVIESRHSNCGIILLGDINKLDTAKLKSNFDLKQTVYFPTRGRNTLDQILTNHQSSDRPLVCQTTALSKCSLKIAQ